MTASFPVLTRRPSQNIQITHDPNPNNDRCESVLATNPNNSLNMVGSSKRFTDPKQYRFALAAYATFDAGTTWTITDNLQLPTSSGGVRANGASDPAVAWDNNGSAYIVGLPFAQTTATSYQVLGISVHKSTDGGATWGQPLMIHESGGDDKPGAAGDGSASSPHKGNLYCAWDDVATLRFARSLDHGKSWLGVGNQVAGKGFDGIVSDSFSPEVAVASDGTVYIVWLAGTKIKFVRSGDGGNTFSMPTVAVDGLLPLAAAQGGLYPKLPGGTFRVETVPTVCAGPNATLTVAWADRREGNSRIYYRRSVDGGATWFGPASGQRLTDGVSDSPTQLYDFDPQLAVTAEGAIGCAFYEFGPRGSQASSPNLIDVVMVASLDLAATFDERIIVTDQPWDPSIDAPLSHGDPSTTFIGDYFGLASASGGWYTFWTDTRTGVQELFGSQVLQSYLAVPRGEDIWIQILFGVINDAGGVGVVGGHLVPIPPRGPELEILTALLIAKLSAKIDGQAGRTLRASSMNAVIDIARRDIGPTLPSSS
jgi:hypothetical protein